MQDWWRPYDNKIVAYIIERPKGFTPFLARCVPDGDRDLSFEDARLADDCILSVLESGPKVGSVEEALNLIKAKAADTKIFEIFPVPIPPGMMGISWLLEPFMKKHGFDPREDATSLDSK